MSGFKLYNNIDVPTNASYSILVADLESSFEEGYRCVGNAGSGNFVLTVTGTPILNMQVFLLWEATTTGTVTILGTAMPSTIKDKKVLITCTYNGSAWQVHFDVDANSAGVIENSSISATANIDRTKLASGSNNHIVINNGSGVMSSEATLAASRGGLATDASAFTGVVKASTGTFSAASIVNSDISASADISFSKLAALTSGRILVGNGSNVATSVALSGDATLANTGALTIANDAITTVKILDDAVTTNKILDDNVVSSKVSADLRKFVLTRELSFEAGEQGEYRIVIPGKCKLLYPVVRVTKAIAGTDDATITLQNDAGTTMTGTAGVVTIAASTAFGSQTSGSITGNNTFAATGEQIKIVTAKTTAGGKCSIDLLFEYED